MIGAYWANFINSSASLQRLTEWDVDLRYEPYEGDLFDEAIYKLHLPNIIYPLMPSPVVCHLMETPKTFGFYYAPDWAVVAVGPTGYPEACLLRFLYVDDLDVSEKIQDIAASGIKVSSVQGRWVWPKAAIATAAQRKARDMIQWVST